MTETPGGAGAVPELADAVAEARSLAREQVAAAWQLHLDRIREQIDSGWREALDDIFGQRFDDVEQRMLRGFECAIAERARVETERASGFIRQETRRELTDTINSAVRRLKQAEDLPGRVRTLLDATADFCGHAAVFTLHDQWLQFEAARGFDADAGQRISLRAAPAFGSAVDSLDTVVAAATARELSPQIVEISGADPGAKVYLFPLVLHRQVVAVLYAEPSAEGSIDVSALELLASLAAGAFQGQETAGAAGRPPLVQIGVAAPAPAASNTWSGLDKADQEIHLRAQRFARTRIAEVVLRKMQAVRAGRASLNLYAALREEIDAGRDAFRRDFCETCPTMADYFHLEMVRTLAKDDPGLLGPDYPGPLL